MKKLTIRKMTMVQQATLADVLREECSSSNSAPHLDLVSHGVLALRSEEERIAVYKRLGRAGSAFRVIEAS